MTPFFYFFNPYMLIFLSDSSDFVSISTGYSFQTLNFIFERSEVLRYKFRTTSVPILIGFELTKYKLQPGLRTGIYVIHQRMGDYTNSIENYAIKHDVTMDDKSYPTSYYLGLLLKYRILSQIKLRMEANYQWSLSSHTYDLPDIFDPSSRFEFSLGLAYSIIIHH